MGRIIAIDFGKKRTGLAVTDPLQIIANPLDTVDSKELIGYLKVYFAKEKVDEIVIGYPLNFDDTPTDATPLVEKCIRQLNHVFPHIPVHKEDERMTSAQASRAISQLHLSKKKREDKGLIDRISAVIILQDFLSSR